MGETLHLYETETCDYVGDAEMTGQEVKFPDFIDGWPDVLDCRPPPYTDKSLDENCDFAVHVRKPYILVDASESEDDDAA
ncbi:MAG: hypothetical protein ABEN55_03075 [Bradymonadaceae bacterium]